MSRAKIHSGVCLACCCSFPSERTKTQFCSRSCASKATQRMRKERGDFKNKILDHVILRAVNLINSGMTWKNAAKAIGLDHTTLRKRVRLLGCPVRRGLRGSRLPRTLNVPTDDATLAYIAAMIDGEGSVQMYRGKRLSLCVYIYNTSLDLMKWLALVGGVYVPRHTLPHRKQGYEWRVKGREDALALLMAVEPFMIIKKKQAHEAIEFLQREIGKNYFNAQNVSPTGLNLNSLIAAMQAAKRNKPPA